MQVITTHDQPPIPDRSMDWSAHIDGTEEDGPYGRGPTELAAAIALLHELVADDCDLPTFIAGLEKVMQLELARMDKLELVNYQVKYGYGKAMHTVMGFV